MKKNILPVAADVLSCGRFEIWRKIIPDAADLRLVAADLRFDAY